MQDDEAKPESELTVFFEGLDARLNSARQVRDAYNEQIALDFNMLQFFKPPETKISQILAFFLDPEEKHAQKTAFLRTFLDHFGLADTTKGLLSADQHIGATPEYVVRGNRKIDVAVIFGNGKFAVAIENKIYEETADQPNQVLDYCEALKNETGGRYVLFYLSPGGHPPSEESIPEKVAQKLRSEKKLRNISYKDILDLLTKYETVCRADNVRAFIRQFAQYIRKQILRDTFMGEPNPVVDYLRKHPEMLRHADAVGQAAESLRQEFFNAFWKRVADHLKAENLTIPVGAPRPGPHKGDSQLEVRHSSGRPFAFEQPTGTLAGPSVFYEPNKWYPPVYIAINLGPPLDSLSPVLKERVGKLEESLRVQFGGFSEPPNWMWRAAVPLPDPKFDSFDTICEFLKHGDSAEVRAKATEAAQKISQYVKAAESLWVELLK